MEMKRFSIVYKLMALVGFFLLAVTLTVTWKNASIFEQMSSDREEAFNLDLVDSKTQALDVIIQSSIDKEIALGLQAIKNDSTLEAEFNTLDDYLAFKVTDLLNGKVYKYQKNDLNSQLLSSIETRFLELDTYNSIVSSGKIFILNGPVGSDPFYIIGIPLVRDSNNMITTIAWGAWRLSQLSKIIPHQSERELFILDSLGKTLLHSNEKKILNAEDLGNLPIVKDAQNTELPTMQKYYGDKKETLGAFSKSRFGLVVATLLPSKVIFEPSRLVKNNSYYILGIAFSISIILIFLFAQRITSPIERLETFTHEIANGNFDIQAGKEIQTWDEVGTLARAFDHMTQGLKEREKMKQVFNKFHGSAVTEELLKSELTRGGTHAEITVLFSDIRGFTDFSEKHTPMEVVQMLNEYFDIMVGIINRNGGVVDKFVGDAIMAVWGAPQKTEDDEMKAAKAAVEMRKGLIEFNKSREERGLVPIKTGIGLHSGPAVAGTIGASERMEYTVIGDTVNTASRIESETKNFKTDILISEAFFRKLSPHVLCEIAGETKVKGKADHLLLYKIIDYKEISQEESLEELPPLPIGTFSLSNS